MTAGAALDASSSLPLGPGKPAPGGALLPRRGNGTLRLVGRLAMRLTGWRFEGALPDVPRVVIAVAPHTSNWDFPVGVMAMFALDLRIHWLGKHTIFAWPVGPVLRAIGGEPVNRAAPGGIVGEAAAKVRAADRYILALSTEGTRRRLAEWKTGFHRIAREAGVPILPVRLDWSRKVIGLGAPFQPTADVAGDVRLLRTQFRASMARIPANYVE